MAMMPKRIKHRKVQRGRITGFATRGNRVVFGEYALQATQGGWIPAKTIEAGRIAAQQYLRGEGKLFIRIFPNKPIILQQCFSCLLIKGPPELAIIVLLLFLIIPDGRQGIFQQSRIRIASFQQLPQLLSNLLRQLLIRFVTIIPYKPHPIIRQSLINPILCIPSAPIILVPCRFL